MNIGRPEIVCVLALVAQVWAGRTLPMRPGAIAYALIAPLAVAVATRAFN